MDVQFGRKIFECHLPTVQHLANINKVHPKGVSVVHRRAATIQCTKNSVPEVFDGLWNAGMKVDADDSRLFVL